MFDMKPNCLYRNGYNYTNFKPSWVVCDNILGNPGLSVCQGLVGCFGHSSRFNYELSSGKGLNLIGNKALSVVC